MKRASILLISIVLFVFSANSQNLSTPAKTLLSYSESSNGLASPAWEGGRSELEFADINGDGNVDIVTVGDHGNPGIQSGEQGLMVYFGDGQGHWSVQMEGELGYGGVAAGDVNNDGFMDVGYGMHHNYSSTDFGDQLMEVVLGNGTGTGWVPWDDELATSGEDWGMFGTDFADFDNDGDLDIGSISFGCCAGVHLYKNNLDGTWSHSFGFIDGNSDMIFEFGDINNDGNVDFVVSHDAGTAYFGDGAGNFTWNDAGLPAGELLGLAGPSLGDVDNDGGMDLAFVNNDGGLNVYLYNEDIWEWTNWSDTLPASGDFEVTQLADMNSDGFIDLAAYGNGVFQLFLGNGAGNWTADATFTTGDPGSFQAFRVGGDVDHNGRPDIILVEEEEISWFTYQNYLKCYRENSISFTLSVTPVFPHGYELFRPGSVKTIKWNSAVLFSEESSVMTLDISTTGPDGPWTNIALQAPNNGSYQWIVPQANSSDCYIRYTVTAGQFTDSGMNALPFTITDGTIGIGETFANGSAWEVYPNPACGQLTVDSRQHVLNPALSDEGSTVDSRQSKVRLEILDVFGSVLLEVQNVLSLPYQVDVSALKPGIYFVRLSDDSSSISTGKFLKIYD